MLAGRWHADAATPSHWPRQPATSPSSAVLPSPAAPMQPPPPSAAAEQQRQRERQQQRQQPAQPSPAHLNSPLLVPVSAGSLTPLCLNSSSFSFTNRLKAAGQGIHLRNYCLFIYVTSTNSLEAAGQGRTGEGRQQGCDADRAQAGRRQGWASPPINTGRQAGGADTCVHGSNTQAQRGQKASKLGEPVGLRLPFSLRFSPVAAARSSALTLFCLLSTEGTAWKHAQLVHSVQGRRGQEGPHPCRAAHAGQAALPASCQQQPPFAPAPPLSVHPHTPHVNRLGGRLPVSE